MSIIRNLIPNPSFEAGTTGWTSAGDAGFIRTADTNMQGQVGASLARATAAGGGSFLVVNMDPAMPKLSVAAGQWLAVSAWVAADSSIDVRIEVRWYDSVGSQLSASVSPEYLAGWYAGRRIPVVRDVPAGAVSAAVYIVATSTTVGAVIPAGARLWVDAVQAHVGATQAEVENALASGYHDGESPGWAWEGARHTSSSRGPSGGYEPEAQLQRAGARIDWIDLVPGFAESAEAQTVVQVTADPSRDPYITVREGRDARGTLTMHFVHETGYGLPGDRAQRVQESLLTGAPHTLAFHQPTTDDYLAGLGAPLELVPCGPVRRVRQALADETWTVECDFHRTVTPT